MSESQESPAKPDPGALRLKKRTAEEEQAVNKSPFADRSPTPSGKKKKTKKKRRKKSGASLAMVLAQGITSCMIALLIFGLFFAHQLLEWEILSEGDALLARNLLVAGFFLVLIIESFTEDLLQGILCLFLLPYTVFYGVFISDTSAVRGLTIAMLIFLGMEMVLTPDDAIVPEAQARVSGWIQAGQDKLIYPDGRPQAGFE